MTTLMDHPDGDFKVKYEGEHELLWITCEKSHQAIHLTPIGLIDLGQRLVKEGVTILIDNPA